MAKKLLTEWVSTVKVDRKLIKESIDNNSDLYLEGILQRADAKNQNGRIYPKKILDRELNKYQTLIKENRALGELDHPESPIISLSNASHIVTEAHWNDKNEVVGKIKILSTPAGNIVKQLLAAEVMIGISSRAMGSVRELDENTVEVLDDLELVCWDLVSNPSTHQGWMRPNAINESAAIIEVKKEIKKANKINKLINEIISGV